MKSIKNLMLLSVNKQSGEQNSKIEALVNQLNTDLFKIC